MSRTDSWKTWAVVIAILLFSGFLAAAWPLITSFGGGSAPSITLNPETVTITIPPINAVGFAGLSFEIYSLVAFAVLGVVVFGAVIGVGILFTVLILPLSKQVVKTNDSEEFQERNAKLEKREEEKLAHKREGRAAATSQQRDYSRWAVIATSMAILMFSIFLGFLFASSLFPSPELTTEDEIINIAGVIAAAFALVTLFVLLLRMNPKRLAAVDESDQAGIPWDTIVIILLGVLVLGLGVGITVFLNNPL